MHSTTESGSPGAQSWAHPCIAEGLEPAPESLKLSVHLSNSLALIGGVLAGVQDAEVHLVNNVFFSPLSLHAKGQENQDSVAMENG